MLSADDACRSFMDAVADKLFVVEGDGPVRMFDGQFSEVAAHLGLLQYCVASQACFRKAHDMHSGSMCSSMRQPSSTAVLRSAGGHGEVWRPSSEGLKCPEAPRTRAPGSNAEQRESASVSERSFRRRRQCGLQQWQADAWLSVRPTLASWRYCAFGCPEKARRSQTAFTVPSLVQRRPVSLAVWVAGNAKNLRDWKLSLRG